MIKHLLAVVSLLSLSACGGNFGKLVKGDESAPVKNTSAPPSAPVLLASLPAPYSGYGAPVDGGGCAFEKLASTAGNEVGIAGWAFIDAKTGALAERIILKVDSSGSVKYVLPKGTERPDVADYFKNPKLVNSGFEQALPLPKDQRPAVISVLLPFDGKLFQCGTELRIEE